MKRVLLFLATNLAVMLVLGTAASLLGVNRYLTAQGLNLGLLLGFAAVMGFGGAFVSLLLSRTMAKWTTGARVIDRPANEAEAWLVETVGRLARASGLPQPEVAVYEGEPNAFATGASRRSSLVAVSTGLLRSMDRREVEAVLAHEVAHVANGDMVTLTLIQGVVNTFVIFLSRVIGFVVDQALRRGDDERSGPGIGYYAGVMICDLLFGILASLIVMAFSRRREFRADAGAARLLGTPSPMIAALQRLGGLQPGALPQTVATAGIAGRPAWTRLFATHPALEERIEALRRGPAA
jgi:heat shock protein HtpX